MVEVFDVEDSDDDDVKPAATPVKKNGEDNSKDDKPVFSSPLLPRKTPPIYDDREQDPTVYGTLLHVVPDNFMDDRDGARKGVQGLIATIDGTESKNYEYGLIALLLGNGQYQDVLNQTQVFPKIFDVIGKNGKPVPSNGSRYNKRFILWTFHGDNPTLTKEQCIQLWNYYWQETVSSGAFSLGKIKKQPKVHPTKGYTKIDAWGQGLTIDQFRTIVQHHAFPHKYAGLKSFFRYSPNNVYSFYAAGKVDIEAAKRFGLRKHFAIPLHDDDKEQKPLLSPTDQNRYDEIFPALPQVVKSEKNYEVIVLDHEDEAGCKYIEQTYTLHFTINCFFCRTRQQAKPSVENSSSTKNLKPSINFRTPTNTNQVTPTNASLTSARNLLLAIVRNETAPVATVKITKFGMHALLAVRSTRKHRAKFTIQIQTHHYSSTHIL
jgi:hypothetical protein